MGMSPGRMLFSGRVLRMETALSISLSGAATLDIVVEKIFLPLLINIAADFSDQ